MNDENTGIQFKIISELLDNISRLSTAANSLSVTSGIDMDDLEDANKIIRRTAVELDQLTCFIDDIIDVDDDSEEDDDEDEDYEYDDEEDIQ